MIQRQRRSLFTLYLAYVTDYFSWGAAIAFVVLYVVTDAPPFKSLFWDAEVSLGMTYAAFPIGEMIGSPILGDLSDSLGRKKVLIWTFWGSILSMILCSFSLWIGNFPLFLISQLLVGFFSGKQSMVQASIVETQPGTKGQKLAFLAILGGGAWALGPLLGSILMQQPFTTYGGGYLWPNLLACVVYLVGLICTHLFFEDRNRPPSIPVSATKLFQNAGSTFAMTWKEKLFIILILNLVGWYLMIVSLSDFLIERFHLTNTEVGIYNGYFSLSFTLISVIATALVLRRWRVKNVLFWSAMAGSIGLFLLFGADQVVELWTYLAIPTLTEAWIYPVYQTALSDDTNLSNQGKLFGLIGATNGACQLLASLILAGFTQSYIILIAALLFFSSAALLPLLIRKKKKRITS